MNWDQIEGKWKQLTGSARERWGKLTDDDWQTIGGKKDQLMGGFKNDTESPGRKPRNRPTSGLAPWNNRRPTRILRAGL